VLRLGPRDLMRKSGGGALRDYGTPQSGSERVFLPTTREAPPVSPEVTENGMPGRVPHPFGAINVYFFRSGLATPHRLRLPFSSSSEFFLFISGLFSQPADVGLPGTASSVSLPIRPHSANWGPDPRGPEWLRRLPDAGPAPPSMLFARND